MISPIVEFRIMKEIIDKNVVKETVCALLGPNYAFLIEEQASHPDCNILSVIYIPFGTINIKVHLLEMLASLEYPCAYRNSNLNNYHCYYCLYLSLGPT